MRDKARQSIGLRSALAFAALVATTCAPLAQPRDVVVSNQLNVAIYKLYIWPSDLVPRTYSLLSTPLTPNGEVTVKVDDVYGDCKYTFKADLTVPRARRSKVQVRQYRKPRPRNLYIYEVDLCARKAPVAFKDAVGTNFGP